MLFLQPRNNMVDVAQLVRALDCGSKGRGFEPHHLPQIKNRTKRNSSEFLFHFVDKFLLKYFVRRKIFSNFTFEFNEHLLT